MDLSLSQGQEEEEAPRARAATCPSSPVAAIGGLIDSAGSSAFTEDGQEPQQVAPVVVQRRRATHQLLCGGSTRSFQGDKRKSRGSRRASRIRPHATSVESLSHSGVLADFLLRMYKRKKVRLPIGGNGSPLETLLQLMLYQEKGGIKAMAFGVPMLRREELRDLIMTRITCESKEQGVFAPTTPADFARWANIVVNGRNDAKHLRTKVRAWTFTRDLLRMEVAPEQESLWLKKGRMEDFWSTFHDRSLILTEPVIATIGDAEDPDENPSQAWQLPKRPSLGADGPPFGLSWDFEQGVRWKAVGALPGGSRPSTSGTVGNAAVGGLAGTSGIARNASLPTLPRASTPAGGARLGGARTASRSGTAPLGQAVAWPGSRPGSKAGSRPGTSPFTSEVGLGPNRQQKVLPPLASCKQRYLQECDFRKQPPRALGFLMGEKTLNVKGKDFVDGELLAMAATIGDVQILEEVNLSDNSLLTDRSLVQLLRQLSREPLVSALRRLCMGNCVRAGSYTIDATVGLLKAGSALRVLDLSHVTIPVRFQLPLCQAVGRHQALETVNLAETGLQHHELTKDCLRALLCSRTVRLLDIGWNSFNGAVFKSFGGQLVQNVALRSLRVANCATSADTCSAEDTIPPLSLFLEQLAYDKTLTSLDISMNRCDFRTALICEDALDTHNKLKELIMQHNPLGPFGLRSILRLVCREHTGLQIFDTEGCYLGGVPREGMPVYSFTNPGGKYDLQLWRPYHRTMLRMLYKAMEYFALSPEEAFDKVSYTVRSQAVPWKHGSKDSIGVWQVPFEGELSAVFNVQNAILSRLSSAVNAESDATGFLQGFYDLARFKPSVRKVIPLFARWADLGGDAKAQEVFMNALSKDFNLSLSHLQHMCEACRDMTPDLIWRLLPLVEMNEAASFRIGHMFNTMTDFITVHKKMVHFTSLNIENPTGRYHLDLANCSDFAVAERMFLLDRWEAAIDRKHDRKDVSACMNMSHVRNEKYQGRSLQIAGIHSVAEWMLPEQGELVFDYVSNQRPSRKEAVLSEGLWETILIELYQAECEPEDKIAALRSLSHTFYLQSTHVRAMMGYFKRPQERVEVMVTFYMRIVDMHNAKLFRVRFEDREEVRGLQQRLGYASFFPFLQPENAQFELDLSIPDQRLCACMFVQLAIKEKYANLRDYGYRKGTGETIPMPLGVPRSWGDLRTIPSEGVFRATYRCAPEDRNFTFRRELASAYGFFDVDGLEDGDVEWWTGLTEPPEDVLNLLEFFISRFDNVKQAFVKIDGVGGNGQITFRELLDGLEEMECKKFDPRKGQKVTQTKEQRIDTIFRYLDPGGEGSVSRDEWGILQQLWKEFDLSIREFVHFLTLTFGDSLSEAWDALDDDGSGELSEDEWLTAVVNIGYFGPAKVVFALLDMSDDGSISFDEFAVLENYKPKGHQEPAGGVPPVIRE